MKKKLLGIVCCCSFLALPALCLGADGWYGSIDAGGTLPPDSDYSVIGVSTGDIEWDSGFTIDGAIGYTMENFRVEGEIAYQENDIDTVTAFGVPIPGASGDSSMLTFLVNGYLDIDLGNRFTPFLTAGIGAANIDFDTPGASDDDTVFAYQIGAGVGFAMSDTVTLDLRYRFLGTSDPEFTLAGVPTETESTSHNITAGLRFAF